MDIEDITYCEIDTSLDGLINLAIEAAFSGESVGLTTRAQHAPFLLLKFFDLVDAVGIDNSVKLGKGEVLFFSDNIDEIKSSGISTVFCDRYSKIGRTSLSRLGNIRMIRIV
jgi:hypothetical protein